LGKEVENDERGRWVGKGRLSGMDRRNEVDFTVEAGGFGSRVGNLSSLWLAKLLSEVERRSSEPCR